MIKTPAMVELNPGFKTFKFHQDQFQVSNNIPKSVDTSTEINYKMLESIKAVIAFVCTIKYALVSVTQSYMYALVSLTFQHCQTCSSQLLYQNTESV